MLETITAPLLVVRMGQSMYMIPYTPRSQLKYLIASLVSSLALRLVVRIIDVEKQLLNGLRFLAMAYVYDICNGFNPCQVKSDYTVIRQHLATCLKKCQFSHFFSLPGE